MSNQFLKIIFCLLGIQLLVACGSGIGFSQSSTQVQATSALKNQLHQLVRDKRCTGDSQCKVVVIGVPCTNSLEAVVYSTLSTDPTSLNSLIESLNWEINQNPSQIICAIGVVPPVVNCSSANQCAIVDGGTGPDVCDRGALPRCPRACTASDYSLVGQSCATEGDTCGNAIGDKITCSGGKWFSVVHPPLGTGCNLVCSPN